MKKVVGILACVCIYFALCGCGAEEIISSPKSSAVYADTNNDDYQAGFEAGEKSVRDNPEDYGLISKENANEYVEDQIGPEDAEDVQDIVDEYAEDYGYHK